MRRHLPTILGGRWSLPAELPAVAPGSSDTPIQSPAHAPDLVGLPSTEARRQARLVRIHTEVVERASHQTLWGRVLEQDPPPGGTLEPDSIVTLTVGARPHVTVPDVRGRDEDEALSMLREAGLGTARRAARRSDRVPEGCVVRTRPRAGADVPTGSRVVYVVAAGPRADGDRGHGRRRTGRRPDGSFVSSSD
jgi:beta-lactam-binding protein with PASTA domain